MKYDWEIHYVNGENLTPGMCDAHTHGLNKYGSLELQLVLAFDTSLIGYVLNRVGYFVRNGMELHDGMLIEGVFSDGAMIKAFKTKDFFGDDIFRLIIPDGDYKFPEESEEWPYNLQYRSPYIDATLN